MHGSLRAFEFMEVGSVFEQRYGKEQHDQRIAYADHRIVQALHYILSAGPQFQAARQPQWCGVI